MKCWGASSSVVFSNQPQPRVLVCVVIDDIRIHRSIIRIILCVCVCVQ